MSSYKGLNGMCPAFSTSMQHRYFAILSTLLAHTSQEAAPHTLPIMVCCSLAQQACRRSLSYLLA